MIKDIDPVTGGIVNVGLGALGSVFGADRTRRGARELQRGLDNARGSLAEGFEGSMSYLTPYIDEGQSALQNMNLTQEQIDALELPQYEDMQYSKTLKDFLDPYIQDQINASNLAIEGGQAGAGNLLSSKAVQMLQKNAQDRANQGWADAGDRMWRDKNFTYKTIMDKNAQRRQSYMDQLQKLTDTYGRYSNRYNQGANASFMGSRNTMDYGRGLADFDMQQGNINAIREQTPSGLEHLFNPTSIGGIANLATGLYNKDWGDPMVYGEPTRDAFSTPIPQPVQPNFMQTDINNPMFRHGTMKPFPEFTPQFPEFTPRQG
jgi:hypothetical protein